VSRIALLGGTFDPPHNAHLALAHAALGELGLAEVRWIPAGQPWQKLQGRAVTPAAHRVAMVEAAIRGAGGDPRFTLDRIEVERPGPSYTLDTVRMLAAREPGREWVLLVGQDQYAGLHTWHGWRELLGLVTLAVANRPGVVREPAEQVRALPHRVVPLPMLDISATDIRARVAAGQPITELVPAEVAGYIARHGLYRR
jgi:nicotinate-nucleotide adenylyltransferase